MTTALALRCPPMTLLTLVENAVRHGIDPSEEGGRIEVSVRRARRTLPRRSVTDTGVGLRSAGDGLGTGLSNLRERLQLAFGGDAQLRLRALAAARRLRRDRLPGAAGRRHDDARARPH